MSSVKENGHSESSGDHSRSNGHITSSQSGGSISPRCLEKPFLIGVAGGTASGKASVCARIMEHLGQHKVEQKERRVVTVSMDSFYKPLTEEDKTKARKGQYNFDHPDACDSKGLLQAIMDIIAGRTVKVPIYDFIHHKWKPDCYQTIYPADVVIFEGILLFYFPEVRDQFQMKLFVDTDPDTRLSRRVMRDSTEKGRNIDQILYQYTTFVKPAFEEFCLPSKKYADVIIPRGADNLVAIELIVQHIQDLLLGPPLNKKSSSQTNKPPQALHRVPSVTENATSRPH